jgi:hypothetical protein
MISTPATRVSLGVYIRRHSKLFCCHGPAGWPGDYLVSAISQCRHLLGLKAPVLHQKTDSGFQSKTDKSVVLELHDERGEFFVVGKPHLPHDLARQFRVFDTLPLDWHSWRDLTVLPP